MKKNLFDEIGGVSVGGRKPKRKAKRRAEAVKPLSASELNELAAAESVIQRVVTSFREGGEALAKIRDQRLYRMTHKTFEAYCRDRWGFSKTQANRLIQAKATSDILVDSGVKPEEIKESTIRPLVGLSPSRVRNVWARAVAKSVDRPPTARLIAAFAHPRAAAAKGHSASSPVAAKVTVKAVVEAIRTACRANPAWPKDVETVLVAEIKKL